MLKVILTFVVILAVVIPIVKKFHAITVMFAVSCISLLVMALVTKTSVLGDNTVGSNYLDVLEFMINTTKTQVGGNVLNSLFILGYIGMMDQMKATDIFATAVASVLKKIKQKYILVAALIIVTAVLKLFMNGAFPVVTLLVAVLYPVLLKCGCSRATICTALVIGTVITWGPAETGVIMTATLAGGDLSVAEFFTAYQIPNKLCVLLVMAIVFVFTSMYWDKKEKAEGGDASVMTEKKLSDIDAPKFLGIYPTFPLLFVIIFNGKILPWALSFPAAILLAVIIAFITNLIIQKKPLVERFNDITIWYKSAGDTLGKVGFIIVSGTLFSSVINKIGGLAVIAEGVSKISGGGAPLVILLVILGFVVTGATVSYMANLNIFVPFAVTISNATGMSVYRLAEAANTACGLGTGLTPASATMLFLSELTDTPYPTILKRNIIPLIAGIITTMVFTIIAA